MTARCIYCNRDHEVRDLPYDCPNCGKTLKVLGNSGWLIAQIDREWVDHVAEACNMPDLTLDLRWPKPTHLEVSS